MLEPKLKAKRWDLKFEEDLLEQWAREPELYAYDPSRGPTYVIDTPPPYPSGEWHPGAVIGYSLIDMVARAQRMLGKAVLFPFGLDRNGINIERTVEEKYGKLLHEWDRGEFIEKCREEISHIGEGILVIARRMGMTMDFANTYYTDADDYRAYSQAIFIDLFHRGLFYRGERPSFYCVYCETPLAEADIVYEPKASQLAWIRFPLDGGGAVTIATTRPELLAACRTVIVHPDDERWRTAVGKTAKVPIFQQGVPVRTHPEAKVDFGSGAAMICSYGDMVDVRLFREFQLEPVKAIDERGRMTDAAGRYAGMEVERAREAVLADLKSAGFLEKLEQVEHQTPLCERSRTPVEFLVSEAWYLKQLEFRDRLRTLANEMEFHRPAIGNFSSIGSTPSRSTGRSAGGGTITRRSRCGTARRAGTSSPPRRGSTTGHGGTRPPSKRAQSAAAGSSSARTACSTRGWTRATRTSGSPAIGRMTHSSRRTSRRPSGRRAPISCGHGSTTPC